MQKYVVLEKKVGETPLQCAEAWRATQSPAFAHVPLSYAGRLDPMASGKLLILIGDECKKQENYHGLDKTYEFSVLFDTSSDTGDVLGIIKAHEQTEVSEATLHSIAKSLQGNIELPYPHYSSKTVRGKPLHTWAIEGRLDEIEIPTKQSTIYTISLRCLKTVSAQEAYDTALAKINSLPPVTELRKAIGNDFRRIDVRESWEAWLATRKGTNVQVATFSCTASSGTYMRTLA